LIKIIHMTLYTKQTYLIKYSARKIECVSYISLFIIETQTIRTYNATEKMVERNAILRTAGGATDWDKEIANVQFIINLQKKFRFLIEIINNLYVINFSSKVYYILI